MARVKFKPSREFLAFQADLKWLASVELAIGILGASAFYADPDSDGFTLVDIAVVNEFGTDDGHIPERPAHRTTYREEEGAMQRRMGGMLRLMLDGKRAKPIFNKLGLYYADRLKRNIMAWSLPPNAPSTVAQKGANNPLIDTGRMLNSIQHEIRNRTQ